MLAALLLNNAEALLKKGGKQFPEQGKKKTYPFISYKSAKEVQAVAERIDTTSIKADAPKLQEKLKEVLTPYRKDGIIDSIVEDTKLGIPSLLDLSTIDFDSILDDVETMMNLKALEDWAEEEEIILLMVH